MFLFSINSNATTVLASSFGYNTTNATNALQNAIDSNNDTIIVDLQSSDWNVGPLNFFSLNNKTIILEKGVKIRAIFGLYSASTSLNTCLFRFVNCSNIIFIGYEAEFIMNKPEYIALNNSEDRHCMSFLIVAL